MFPRPRGFWLSVLRVSLDRIPLTFCCSCINMLLSSWFADVHVCGGARQPHNQGETAIFSFKEARRMQRLRK